MTIFNSNNCFVWIWLPDKNKPVVAGKLEKNDFHHDFFYGQSYLTNPRAIALSKHELPLIKSKRFTSNNLIHPVIRDALPDSWGQRVLTHRYPNVNLSIIDLLTLSSSDRIGALHFQLTADQYLPHHENHATIEQLLEGASLIESGESIPDNLMAALIHGTSIGGARPKALIDAHKKKYIAKFASSTDIYPIVQAEFACMWLADKLSLNTAPVTLARVQEKYVLLVERFDRIQTTNGWSRKFMISGLTMLGLQESEAKYASYLELADQIRRTSPTPTKDLHELFRRMVFNILIGNTDDHAKNHAFFWDGQYYSLTAAYDLCPYPRSGQQATQAMIVGKQGSYSQLSNALTGAAWFELSERDAKQKIDKLIDGVKTHWPEACDAAKLSTIQNKLLTNSAILNPYCFYDTP